MDEGHGGRFDRPAEESGPLQPHLHDGGFRRPRLHEPDSAAGRHARPDRQHVGQNHRNPHPLELPRGPEYPRILHRFARRPQGPCRHGPAHRGFRLPDPPPGRRFAGCDYPRGRLRCDRRIGSLRRQRGQGGHRVPARAAHRPLPAGGFRRRQDRQGPHLQR